MASRKPCFRSPRWFRGTLAVSLVFILCTIGVQGSGPILEDDPIRGIWMSDAFQIVNLEPASVTFLARFLDLDGVQAYTLSDTLAPGQALIYWPTDMIPPLPESFSGTLALAADGLVSLETLHLSEAITEGNMVLENVHEELLGPSSFIPIDRCVLLYIHNLATVTASVDLSAFDPSGGMVDSLMIGIPPEGMRRVYPVMDMMLPWDFEGAIVATANQAIKMTVRRICGGEGSFVAPQEGAQTLLAPFVAPRIPGLASSTLSIQNTVPTFAASGEVAFSNGMTVPFSLPPLGSVVIPSPFTSTWGWAVIGADQPVVVSGVTEKQEPGQEGAFTYGAVGLAQATPAVALPIVLNGYQGWFTDNYLWVQNAGANTATVTIRYVTVPTGTVVWQEGVVPSGDVWQVTVPVLEGETAAAVLQADQPIVALAGAFNPAGNTLDRWMLYRGANYTPTCESVGGADFDWEPITPTVAEVITFTASASGTEVISFAWDLGDGSFAQGEVITHSYDTAGPYTVTVTATNCLGFGLAAASRTLVALSPPPEYRVYLPLVFRGIGP